MVGMTSSPGGRPVAIVTGGGSGIGLASARALARAGYDLVLNGRRAALLEKAVADIRSTAPDATVRYVAGSIAAETTIEALFVLAETTFGRLDAVVSAAATLHVANFAELTLAEWDDMVGTVLRGAAMMAMAATRSFIASKTPGRMIFVSSISSRHADPGLAHYCAAKAGVDALVRSLVVDLSDHGIVANSVAPGWIHTPMIGDFVDSLEPGALRVMNPQARAASADEVGAVVKFLVADAPSFVAGTCITVDGGQTIMNHNIFG